MFPFKRKPASAEAQAGKENKPVRRRKKKAEPAKPWGMYERVIIFIFFVSAPLLGILFLTQSKTANTSGVFSVSPKIFGKSIVRSQPDTSKLKQELVNETKNLTGTYGIWVQALDNSYNVGVNEYALFDGASLFKLPLMIGYYEEVEGGKIDPSSPYTLKYSDAAAGAGVLASLPPGTVVTYHDMVEEMGKDSDNTAFSVMLHILGPDKETSVINEIKMNSTDAGSGTTTPYDMGLLFYKLANGGLLTDSSRTEFLNILKMTSNNSLIPAGIPHEISIAHKYGADDGELNDGGIIYTDNPFVLVILSKDINSGEANAELPKLTKIVYDWATK